MKKCLPPPRPRVPPPRWLEKVCVHGHVQACLHMYGFETLAAGEAPAGAYLAP